jgi:hypothetical protein
VSTSLADDVTGLQRRSASKRRGEFAHLPAWRREKLTTKERRAEMGGLGSPIGPWFERPAARSFGALAGEGFVGLCRAKLGASAGEGLD